MILQLKKKSNTYAIEVKDENYDLIKKTYSEKKNHGLWRLNFDDKTRNISGINAYQLSSEDGFDIGEGNYIVFEDNKVHIFNKSYILKHYDIVVDRDKHPIIDVFKTNGKWYDEISWEEDFCGEVGYIDAHEKLREYIKKKNLYSGNYIFVCENPPVKYSYPICVLPESLKNIEEE